MSLTASARDMAPLASAAAHLAMEWPIKTSGRIPAFARHPTKADCTAKMRGWQTDVCASLSFPMPARSEAASDQTARGLKEIELRNLRAELGGGEIGGAPHFWNWQPLPENTKPNVCRSHPAVATATL